MFQAPGLLGLNFLKSILYFAMRRLIFLSVRPSLPAASVTCTPVASRASLMSSCYKTETASSRVLGSLSSFWIWSQAGRCLASMFPSGPQRTTAHSMMFQLPHVSRPLVRHE